MDLGLEGKRAFIGASSKGLGKAVARELAKEGVEVIINGRTLEDLKETKHEIELASGQKVHYIQADLSVAGERARLIDEIISQFGGVDILVTNTGGPPSGQFETFGKRDWDQAYELLLASAVDLMQSLLPGMKRKGWGRIIAITSMAVKQPVNNLILSNSVRASVIGLVKTLSNEVGKDGITVNSVLPGYTATERLEKLRESNASFEKVLDEVPLGRIGRPAEFAAAVVFLASERAGYITGVSLPIDGGAIKSLL
ncbi:SDR family oxidoreductase [Portibacter marinus]|uniref:SDR family oxidoreductase n=1 Tax=Portibacter marinus TaxID=2898660 RepID=UPI001F44C92F|nr:SDR family oxidoreductase [Portibacter marinus]